MTNFLAMRATALSLCLVAVFLLVVGSSAPASTIVTYGTPTFISADSDVDVSGSLDRAYTFGSGNGSGVTVNGVAFANFTGPTAGGDTTTITSNAGGAYSGGANAPFNTLSSGYQNLVAAGQYEDNGGPTDTIVLNNLVQGQQYLVEFWVNDSRPIQRTEKIDGVTISYFATGGTGTLGQFLKGTFTADSSQSQTFNFTFGNYTGTQINALELRAVPEPGSLTLCGLGAFGLLLFGRRRMATK